MSGGSLEFDTSPEGAYYPGMGRAEQLEKELQELAAYSGDLKTIEVGGRVLAGLFLVSAVVLAVFPEVIFNLSDSDSQALSSWILYAPAVTSAGLAGVCFVLSYYCGTRPMNEPYF